MNVAQGKKVLESAVISPKDVTDGITDGYTGYRGFAHFQWPGYLTVDLETKHSLYCIRFLSASLTTAGSSAHLAETLQLPKCHSPLPCRPHQQFR